MAATAAAKGPRFGQLVVGPPGAGKTTYCNGMQQFLSALGRKTVVVNLDPANDCVPFDVAVDVMELVCLEDVMEECSLGPNGGLVYCMEFLLKNFDWLEKQLEPYSEHYILFDLPGQVELYTHHEAVPQMVARLTKSDYRLTAVHLVDAQHCSDSGHFISMALTSLSTMLRLELPHVNVLSKIDLFEKLGRPPFSLDKYTRLRDLDSLADTVGRRPDDADNLDEFDSDEDEEEDEASAGAMEEGSGAEGRPPPLTFAQRHRRLNHAIVELIDDYSLVGFHALNIEDRDSVASLVRHIDKSNGYTVGLLGEKHGDLASMPEFGEWNDTVAAERFLSTHEEVIEELEH